MTDERRLRFLALHQISVMWNDGRPSLFWRGPSKPGQAGGYYPIADAATLEEAIDAAIARWERKHKQTFE